MYKHYLNSIEDMDNVLDEINDNGEEIVSMFPMSEQGQFITVVKYTERKPSLFDLIKPKDDINGD